MPALAVGQDGEQPVIAAILTRFVITIAPHVSSAVDRPSHMPSVNRTHDYAPEEALRRTLDHSGQRTFKDGTV